MPFDGKRILLTGGAGGLGSLIGHQLVAEGAHVTVLDRARPTTYGHFMQHDLGSAEGLEAAAADVAARDWDVVVNLAGIQHFGPFERQSPEHLTASYLVNLIAPVRLSQAVLPKMKARGSGQIVNVGSIFGSINFAHFVTYSSAKAGLRGFSQALRRELSGTGVDVTYVAPRAVRTALNSPAVMEFAKLTHMNMDAPEKIAERIVGAIRARKRDVYFGFPEALFVRVNALFPGLVDGALAANDRKAARLFAG
ncbi:SDR family NAD(P)-dependent oxidoreductase [Phenylobacterium sp.]|uniref:SDR family NAD(P)-dependent oxidoreductase n=1 Tax=Phenylobacterium sp. TaxID=1871053 RepID=UPI0035B1C7C9